jgi:hypothetical protein
MSASSSSSSSTPVHDLRSSSFHHRGGKTILSLIYQSNFDHYHLSSLFLFSSCFCFVFTMPQQNHGYNHHHHHRATKIGELSSSNFALVFFLFFLVFIFLSSIRIYESSASVPDLSLHGVLKLFFSSRRRRRRK